MLRILTILSISLSVLSSLSAETFYVRQAATGTGTSWENAFGELTDALQVATFGDTILVSAGTYYPTTTTAREATFELSDGLYIQGGYAPTGSPTLGDSNPEIYPTVLSGNIGDPTLDTDNSYHVVTIASATTRLVLHSLIIADGYANVDGDTDQHGAGVFFSASSNSIADGVQLVRCSFERHRANNGGAVFILADSVEVQVLFRDCQFHGNKARFGAGVHAETLAEGQLEFGIRSSQFLRNSSTEAGGAIANYANGGNILFAVVATSFIENEGTLGGAIYNFPNGASLISDVENCIFSKNIAESGGGVENFAFGTDRLQLNLRSCTFSGNRAEVGAGVSLLGIGANLQATNTILWDNVATDEGNSLSSQFDAIASLQNCMIEEPNCGGISFNNTICRDVIFATDPLFQNADAHQLNLLPCSPAIDQGVLTVGGTDFAGQTRIVGERNDIGAYEVQRSATDSIVYVNASNSRTIQDGGTWETAFSDLQRALNLVECGIATEIWMTSGFYYPTTIAEGRLTPNFEIHTPVRILGQFAGTERTPEERNLSNRPTVLDGNIGDQNEVTDNAAQLLHLTASVTLDRLRIQNAYADQDGAAIYIAGSDTTTVILQDCRIADNETTANGGGIAVVSGNARIEHCYFQNNRAGVFGGAYYRTAQADTRIRNTFWMDNQAMSGGAIYQVGSFDNTIDLPIVNSIFARNIATDNGGAIYNAAASTTLINCTVTDNQAMAGAAIYNVSASDLTQININTIFSNHRAGEVFVFGLQARGRFDHCLLSDNSSCPQGAECELVIFDELPLFGESQPDEYRPLPCSPIQNNAATAFAPQQDIFNTPRMQTDSLADIGAVEINMTQSGIPAIVTGSTVDGCSPNSTGRISIEPSPDWSFPVQIIINADTTVAMQSDIITIDSLLAADYMFDVVDAVGCSYSYETTVDSVVNDIFIIVDVLNGISCFDACDALINVVASGSTDYTFDWSDGERGQQRSICAGDYELTVTDANGCVLVRPVTIEQPSMPLTVETTVINTTDSESADGSISVVVTGGTPDYTFAWSDGTVDTTELTNLPSGDYELTVTDANGCTFTTLVVVGATTVALELNSINVTAPVCAGDSTGQIVVDVSGGVGEISFDWAPAAADTNVLDGLGAGLYGLTISDEMGPQIDTIIEVVAPEAIRILNSDVLHPTCVNRCDGEILLELEAGEPPFSISWSVDDPTAPLDELCAGDYVITVTDNKGCSAVSDTITLSAPDSIFIELVIEDDNGTANGAIFANVEGGSPGYAFQWTDEAGNALDETGTFISNLLAGVYCLVVTDFNGCVDSRCATVGLNTSTTDLALPSAWQLFPIPAQTEVEVYVDFALKDDWKWQLLDINGQILKTAAITQTVFSVSTEQLAAGMYYMRLQSAEASTIKPLIVMP